MAFSLAKLVTKSMFLFRPVTAAATSRLLLCTDTILRNSDFDPFDYDDTLNLKGRFCNDDILSVEKVLKDAYCSQVSATRNLARLLNLMDIETLNVDHLGPCGCPRWDVMEDTKAIYLVRDMSEYAEEEEKEEEEDDEEVVIKEKVIFGEYFYDCISVSTRVRSIRILVGWKDRNPGVNNRGYLIDIYLPPSVYKEEVWNGIDKKTKNAITGGVRNDVLKITIPKKTSDTISSISTQLKFFK